MKYPQIEVELTGKDGSAGSIMAAVSKALKRGGVTEAEINMFRRECMSGDYDNLLRTAMKWVDVS
jgi:hypothetical protein